MKTTFKFLPLLLGALLFPSCSQVGDASMQPIPNGNTFNANAMTELRLSRLTEPMVWGQTYKDPQMDSIIPGGVKWDSTGVLGNEEYCKDSGNWYPYVTYAPLYQDREVFLTRIQSVADEVELLNPGKLMVSGSWKFVTDVNRGIHIYNDSDPANPQKVAFLNVPGVLDIALKNKTLYANAYSALIAIDITDPLNAKAVEMIPTAFPPVYSIGGPIMDSLGNVAVAWRADTVFACNRYEIMYAEGVSTTVGTNAITPKADSSPVLGQNASMSRFAISADWLYTVDASALRLFDIRVDQSPKKDAIVETGAWDLETIFRDGDGLFLGSMTGMHIYDHSKGGVPVKASTYSHITSCDPVVVQEGIAYVTLRSGNRCANGKNELNILDVENLYEPKLLSALPMKNPAGLAVEDSTVFICEGEFGLAVIDIKDPLNPTEIGRTSDVYPEDVLADQGILTLIGPDGIWRMDYQDRLNLKELSFTPVVH
jgi:hypothetical protein